MEKPAPCSTAACTASALVASLGHVTKVPPTNGQLAHGEIAQIRWQTPATAQGPATQTEPPQVSQLVAQIRGHGTTVGEGVLLSGREQAACGCTSRPLPSLDGLRRDRQLKQALIHRPDPLPPQHCLRHQPHHRLVPARLRLRPPRRRVPCVTPFPGKLTQGPAVKIGRPPPARCA